MDPISLNSDTLKQALNALMLRNRITSMNIANIETPGFYRNVVRFEDSLMESMRGTGEIQAEVEQTSQIPVMEEEMMTLADTQIRTQLLFRSIRNRFSMLEAAMRVR